MIAESGHYALVLALGLALIQSIVPLIGARLRDAALMNVARSTALAQLLFVGASFVALVMLHVNSDFSVANVYENSHSMKPLLYKITGVWGNHEGSMLLWVSILALFGGLVAAFGNNLPLSLRAHVLAVQAWVASAFYLFILVTSNPFLRIANPPIEGRDLNPVLQDIGLAVHPPMLYLGYVGFSISFSFAIAGEESTKGPISETYDQLDKAYRTQWEWILKNSKLPYFTPMTSGWDKRPWGGSSPAAHDNSVSTPETFESHLRAAKALMDAYPERSKRTGMLCCWNEFGEGSYIEPTKRHGMRYLEKVQDVFGQ